MHTKTRPNWHPKPLLFTPVGTHFTKHTYTCLTNINTDLLKTSPHQRMHSKNGISARGQSSLYVWHCGCVPPNGVTRLPKFPLCSVLCQISLNKVESPAEMVRLCIKNTFEHKNAAQMEHHSVQKLTNNFFGILCIYTNSPAATSSPFSLRKFQ